MLFQNALFGKLKSKFFKVNFFPILNRFHKSFLIGLETMYVALNEKLLRLNVYYFMAGREAQRR